MAKYLFELCERNLTTAHTGGALSDEDAKLEAVRFMGEVLRDLASLDVGNISVAVLKDGHVIYNVSAVISSVH